MKYKKLVAGLVLSVCGFSAHAEQIGSVDTVFKMFGPDHKIVVEAFDDPDITNVTCYISRAVTGGLKGAFGVAEDTSDASISCHQTGPIRFRSAIAAGKNGEEVFNERRSLLFKELHVTRFHDAQSNTLVYMTWSDRLIEGSPRNSISAVPLATWNGVAAQPARFDR